ncbi:MAG: phenylacetate--CoA ligase, partial [Epulopiscium sp.]|nr:phenylacetate--CoA ligase [Candidatus Epulonipiscium sp.]
QIYMEVIDPVTLKPVKDGERGELVLTTLRKQARPMIRFRTGDIAIVNREKCGCGRTHGRIQIVGRLDDMLIVSGVNIFPSDIEFIVRNIKELTGEYRVYALSENFTTKFKVEVEKFADVSISNEALAEKVSQNIKARLGVKPKEVVILKEGALPRATHKAKRFIDLR